MLLDYSMEREVKLWADSYKKTMKVAKRAISSWSFSAPVESYCGNEYRGINSFLRNETDCETNRYREMADILSIVLCLAPRIPENIVVYRLVDDNFIAEFMEEVIKVIDEAKRKHDVSNLDELDFVKKAGETELNHSTIANIVENKDFNITEVEPEMPMARISFSKPLNEVEKVKERMGERTNKAVGEKLFEYYCEMEEI